MLTDLALSLASVDPTRNVFVPAGNVPLRLKVTSVVAPAASETANVSVAFAPPTMRKSDELGVWYVR
jgi:hypothetical protein